MRAQIHAFTVAGRNAQDGVSLAQTAEGSLQETSNNLSRMRELAVQASNGTLSTTDRAALDVEFQALSAEIDRVATQSTFNGVVLLDGSAASLDIQVGVNAGETITVNLNATAATLGISGEDVTDVANSQSAITAIDAAIDLLNTARGKLGASQNRLQSAYSSVKTARENTSAAESRIRDVDFAAETADLTRNTILQQAATSVLQQANVQPQLALSLLRG
jgi:flagellin